MIKGHSNLHNASIAGACILIMYFGFIRGPNDKKDKKGNIIASFNGFTSYLIVTDEVSRYSWVFLIKDKTPPICTIDQLLNQHGLKSGTRRFRTDQGGELTKIEAFYNLIRKHNYVIEATGAYTSFKIEKRR